MLTRIKTASLIGVKGYLVTVETDIHKGMPAFNVVGLADTTIKEALMRIRPAINNSGFHFPGDRVTVNLVPAGKQKEGSHFDLPIALGVILSGLECEMPQDTAFIGEVSLDGRINPVNGALPLAMSIRGEGVRTIVVPKGNADEVSILRDMRIIPVETLEDAVLFAMTPGVFEPYERMQIEKERGAPFDFSQVIGHEDVKRSLVIAAAGRHGVLMMGGPGCGKTMMAKRIPSIMPSLTYEEQLEITGIYSVAGLLNDGGGIITERPFRSPHHTISPVGLTGGGSGRIRPGELSLAHEGVLFLDEFGEFDHRAIDAMRQPLEEGVVRINRNTEEITFPSSALVVIASNPCKCGYLWDDNRVCTCTGKQLDAYRRKLTGPFADRIDMFIKVSPVPIDDIAKDEQRGAGSQELRRMVESCSSLQRERYEGTSYRFNGDLDEKGIETYCQMTKEAKALLGRAYEDMNMTMRAYGKVIKISRTIADLEDSAVISDEHIAEALMYRLKG